MVDDDDERTEPSGTNEIHCMGPDCPGFLSWARAAEKHVDSETLPDGAYVPRQFSVSWDVVDHSEPPCEWFLQRSLVDAMNVAKCEGCDKPLPVEPSTIDYVCGECIKEVRALVERAGRRFTVGDATMARVKDLLDACVPLPADDELETKPVSVRCIVTVSAYALGKQLGIDAAMRELERQMHHPDVASLPAARCVYRLRQMTGVLVRADTGGTVLGQVRSRHADEAWKSGAEVWISIDDDVEATSATLRDLLEAARGPLPRVVVAPCILRIAPDALGPGRVMVNVDLPRIISGERLLSSGARVRTITRAGFGLVAVNRAALEALRAASTHLEYVDRDGEKRLGLFHDELRDGVWLSEDLAFFARCTAAGIEVETLLTGHTSHGGETLDLSRIAS